MSKVLIDRELLERVCHVDNSTRQTARRELRTILATTSGTPAMPAKAYYHEAPNEYGGFNKSVGLEVRKAFADAPLVLESDALAQIACLEGEISKRDARILELESDLAGTQSRVLSLQDQWRKLDAELAALKAQEPVAEIALSDDGYKIGLLGALRNHRLPIGTKLYAAPVSEAKAHGVVMPEPLMAAITRADDVLHALSNWESSSVKLEQRHGSEWTKEVDAIRRELHTQLARLNAAPVQQVSVPDASTDFSQFLSAVMDAAGLVRHGRRSKELSEYLGSKCMEYRFFAAPAAPAADAWIPVSERLPAVESRLDQECRVGTLSIAPLNVSAAVLVFDGEKVRSTRLEWFDGCLPLPYCITHWMPLPAAPAAHRAKGVV